MIAQKRAHGNGTRSTSPETSEASPTNGAPLDEPSPPVTSDGFPTDTLTRGLLYFGLTHHEAQMYHTLLRNGPSTARSAIQQSRLDRATGYRILARLRARGLVSATGYRPQRFVALDAGRLIDRVTAVLRDELDLHRVVRDIYLQALPAPRENVPGPMHAPPSPADPRRPPIGIASRQYRLMPSTEATVQTVVGHIQAAREEVGGLLRPAATPESSRARIRDALVAALARGVRVKLVLDYHPTELDFLTSILHEAPEPSHGLEVRFYAPQLMRLFLFDHKAAVRCLSGPVTGTHGPDVCLFTADPEFVRLQSSRFQTVWREGVPLEQALRYPQGSVVAPPSASIELRQWVERLGRVDPRTFPADALGFSAMRSFRP